MSETHDKARDAGSKQGASGPRPMQTWRKALVGLAVVCAVAGLGMELMGTPEPAAATSTGTSGAASLVGESGAQAHSAPNESSWAPYLVRGGFSFLVAFCVGLALRKSLRIGALLVGLAVLAAVGLHYAGVIDLDWIAIRAEAADLADKLEGRARGFLDFGKRSLPTTAAGIAGLGGGFWRS